MEPQTLSIRGARMHNLKNIDVDLPRNALVVFTGLSGSGKSTLAFDTLYAEGQRRYVESLSTYARQFLGQMNKPDVDSLEGLSPAVSIEQKTTSRNPRSTVGTVTEIYDHLRLLFARCGRPYCPECGEEIRSQSVEDMVNTLLARPEGTRVILLAPSRVTTHVVEQSRLSGFMLAPFKTGYHLAHHVDTSVPWRNLDILHVELETAGWITPGMTHPTYRALWHFLATGVRS